MKNLKLTFILICSLLFANSNLQAQAPEKINYQAVARNLAGNPLVNQAVGLEFNIRQGSPTGAVVYSETHTGVSTNQFGLFTAEIGGGTVNSGIFSAINWGLSSFYLQVTIDGNILPATQLLSVPFALYAKESANGPAGLPGKNSLSLSTPYTGPACINGGTQVDAGLDDNNDGTLQPLEIDYTYIICNGTNGTNGTNGLPGSNGVDGISIDSTINNNNGTFTIYYSNGTSFTTSDLTGPAGTNGTSGTTYFAGNGISLSGDTITNLGDLDNNPTNELQILSVSNDTIFLSNGGFAPLPSAGGFWTQLGGSIHNNNIGKVGIGTSTPIHQLSVASNDSVVASFLGTNPSVSAIVVANVNPNAATGIVFFNGTDTTSYIFLNPTTNTLAIRNNSVNGNIQISTDSVLVNQGLILVNQAQNSIYNQSDTIYSYSSSGEIINVNSGLFLTDSLYVLGSNATNTNWVLANDGFGQAKWTDPSTIVGSVGDNWGSQVVIHDTTLTGTGIAGTPLSVNSNIIPTQTSQLTNNSGFITSPNDGDTSATNELQVLSFANDTLYLSNGNAIYLPPAAGDNWGSDSVITAGTNISGSGTSANPLMVLDNDTSASNELQVLSFANDTLYLSNGNAVYLPPAAGDSWGSDSVITSGANISGSGTSANPLMVFDNDTSATNEIQTLSLAGDTLSISGGNNVNLSTLSGTTYTAGAGINLTGDSITNTAPDQTVVITGGGTTIVTSAYPSFIVTTNDNDTSATNEIQNLSNTISPGTVTIGITGGASTTFSIDDTDANPSNELITSFGVNGTSDSLVIKEAGNDWAVPLSSLSSAANSWNLTGNAGTNATTNFIGTTDNVALNFRVNNQIAGKIDSAVANSFFGFLAGATSTGNNNTAIGYNALFSNTTGNYNTAHGANALYKNSSANFNTAFGYNTLYFNTTGQYNVAIGHYTLYQNTTGTLNTAIGGAALQNNSIGQSNTVTGYNALYQNTSGNYNTGFGMYSLYYNQTGSNNTAVGYQAGFGPSVNSHNNNSLFGYRAGYALTTGSNNILMGFQAGDAITTGGSNIIIGYDIDAPIIAGSNQLSIGNLIFGIGVDGVGTTLSSGKIGIGTSTPSAKLDVQNAANNVNTFSSIHTGTNAHAGYFQINNAANNLNAINATTNGSGAAINASNTYNGANAIRDGIYVTTTGAGVAGTVNKAAYFSASGAANNYAAIFDQGNVGIGTNTPGAKLHVNNGQILNNWTNPNSVDPNLMINNWNSASGPGYLTGTLGQVTLTTSDGAEAKFAIQGNAGGDGGSKYGIYGYAMGLGNANYAIYGDANGAAINWAGYFERGNVYIQNTLVLPTGAVNNYILKTDAAGNSSWADPATLVSAGLPSWSLTGNAGTNATTDFIGTTDNVALNFRVNNTTAGKVDSLGRNSFFGFLAGANTSGVVNGNTAMGFQSLYLNATGTQNTAMGVEALRNNTGSYNTANGYTALRENTGGTYNTAIGHSALSTNTTGNNNTATGMSALFANTIGNDNTANGQYALSSNTQGNQNTAYGHRALFNNSTGNNNTATGQNALGGNQTGSGNTANGKEALFSNSSGDWNTATGAQALYSNTTGIYNTADGAGALMNNKIGGYNVAIGTGTLNSNDAGSEGVAIGYQSQYFVNNNATAWNNTNTSVGVLALRGSLTSSANTGLDNTAIGNRSMLNNTSGFGNTATGREALYSNSSGYNNTTMGLQALYSNTTGYANVAIGMGALATNATGNNNTAIGAGADVSGVNLINATAIGAGASVGQSNSLILGSGANVGIGTSTPTAKLDVVNSTLNNTAKFTNTFTSGAQKVAIDGSATGGGAAANMGGSFAATGSTLSNYGIYANAYGNSGTKTGINASATGAGSNIAGQFSASGGSANYALIVPSGGGNVGIGTSTPTATLDVNGTQAFNKSSQNLGANGQINPNISSYVEVTGAGGTYTLTTPSIANGTTIGQLLYIVSNHGGTTIIVNSATVKLNGGANYSLGAYDTVTLMWSGTLWVEMGRSNN